MQNRIFSIFKTLSLNIPNPQTELTYVNEYTFCVAVILSAQATDKSVNEATKILFEKVQTPEEMLDLGEEKLKNYIKSIGLFNNKAKNILKLSETLVHSFNSQLPHERDVLETLPGIGRKSANVISNNLFGKPYIAVDTHVLRLSHRLELSQHTNPLKVEQDLERVVPKQYHKDTNHLLVLHGRYTCTAKNPKCSLCCIKHLCNFEK